jgi:hypothetical protein
VFSALAGLGRGRAIAGGALSRTRRRITLARETPGAAQAATIETPLAGASATATSVKARCRSGPAGCPAAPHFFLEFDDGFGAGQA